MVLVASGLAGVKDRNKRSKLSTVVPATGAPFCVIVTAVLLTLNGLTGSFNFTTTCALTGTSLLPAGGLMATTVGPSTSAPNEVVKLDEEEADLLTGQIGNAKGLDEVSSRERQRTARCKRGTQTIGSDTEAARYWHPEIREHLEGRAVDSQRIDALAELQPNNSISAVHQWRHWPDPPA